MAMGITSDSTVIMHFRITLEDGTEADSSFGEEPMQFQMGDGTLSEGLEQVLLGLPAGARQTFLLSPEQAFGYPDTANIHELPRSDFSMEMVLEPGVIIGFETPSGEELPGLVLEADEEKVKVDFNHPLAGHNLEFEVEILEVE
jgi:FKBP-type peptidyl-prolyl cis-trans isomerase SlpA